MINLIPDWLAQRVDSLILFWRRFYRVSVLAFKLIFKRKISRPKKLRFFFEQSGGAFIKLGQILALRYDLLPTEYTDELLHLWSRVELEPIENMRAVFVAEMGMTPEKYFKTFNSKPIASASISQVYKATLASGEEVAVKIQRPGVAQIFETDFILASVLASFLSWFNLIKWIDWPGLVTEFIIWTRQELDFLIEAKNAEILRAHSQFHDRTFIPKVYLLRSTHRVMISEFVHSLWPIDRVINLLDQEPEQVAEFQKQNNISLAEMGYYFVFDGMRQFIIDGFFHADPHPANVFLLPGNQLGYFDFGIIGQVGNDRLVILRIMYGITNGDLRFVAKTLFDYIKADLEVEINLLKDKQQDLYEHYAKALAKIEEIILDDLHQELEAIARPLYDPKVRPANFNSASVLPALIKKAKEYNVHLPSQLTTFFRTIVISDMVALKLNPDFDFLEAMNKFFITYPLEQTETLISEGKHQEELSAQLDPVSYLNFEEMMELKVLEEERQVAAKEHLIELVLYYAEQYDEVRQLLKIN